MRELFNAELTQVGQDLIGMSRLVQSAITQAGTALLEADLELAQAVIAADHTIDTMEQILDDRCVALLAQQQPVATDLRVVVSALRMSATLERMGDLARHIAQVARGRYPEPAIGHGLRYTFEQMHDATIRVANRVTILLDSRDLDIAAAIERDDDLLDHLHQETFSMLLAHSWRGSTQEAVDVTLVGRYFERFGDHGVSVAKRVTYLVTGDMPAAT